MNGSLAGQWALVTGASKGIGYGIAEKLLGDGANLVLVARNVDDLESARHTLEEVAGPDQRVLVKPADTADRASIAEELKYARSLCTRNNWPMIDVTRRSIEETAAAIVALRPRLR